MKKIVISFTLLVFLLGTGICLADSGIPNLVGTWTVQAEGGVLLKREEFCTEYSNRSEPRKDSLL